MSSILAGFVKGASGQALDSLNKREDAELEMKKAQMLEELKKETAKELAEFEENLPSKKLEREKKMQDMELAGTREARDAESFELGKVDRDRDWTLKQAAEERAIRDQQLQEGKYKLESAATHEQIRASRAQRTAQRRLDEESAKSQNILFKEYETTFDELARAGANPSVLGTYQTMWYNGVNGIGKPRAWNKDEQRRFLSTVRQRHTNEWVDPKTGQKRQGHLTEFSRANSSLDGKLRGD